MNKITLTSPAKLNLFLEIIGKRSDGYHDICTWMQTIDLSDEIVIERSDYEYCTLRSDDTTIPFGKRNLCIQAFDAVKEKVGLEKTVEISLAKSIPLGSGMGGGSSNAATVINGLDKTFDLKMPIETRMEIAAGIGTDVPFFIRGAGAVARGRGTDVSVLPDFPEPVWFVVAKPDASVSTGDAYGWVKDYKGNRDIDQKELAAHVESGDLDYVCSMLHNAFEPLAVKRYPAIGKLKKTLLAEGCLAAQMTGSGSGVFGICEDEKTARSVREAVIDSHTTIFATTCKTL